MKKIRLAETLVAIAEDLVTDVTLTFERESNDRSLDMAFRDIQSFMEKVRQNEGLDSFCLRRDSSEEMEVRLGLSDHEAKEAIVGAIQMKAEKLARRMGIRLKGMESDVDAAGAVDKHIKEILRIAKELIASRVQVYRGMLKFPDGAMTSVDDDGDVVVGSRDSNARLRRRGSHFEADVDNRYDKRFEDLDELADWLTKGNWKFVGID